MFGLLNGGTAGLIWGYLIVWIGYMLVFASIAEMASMFVGRAPSSSPSRTATANRPPQGPDLGRPVPLGLRVCSPRGAAVHQLHHRWVPGARRPRRRAAER